jgi:ligand-binding SRPBCC domain-containing protein
VRVSASTATQVFSVSIESKIESVNAGTAISLRVEKFNVPSALTWLLTASNNEASA